MEDKKIFSIIVPAYNAEKTISRTLISFLSNRDYIKEVIVVDDHSSDATREAVEQWQNLLPLTTIMSEGYHNAGLARKTGLLAATGDWIAFVDSDDCLVTDCLQYVYKKITSCRNVIQVISETMFFEFGSFNPDHITVNSGSCGGVYYYRQYLIDNQLFPHEDLTLAEDEYFNKKISNWINHHDKRSGEVRFLHYPTYEVHHDEGHVSLAFQNWLEYALKAHLLAEEYLIDHILTYAEPTEFWVEEMYITNFIFCYFLYMCAYTNLEEYDLETLYSYQKDFQRALLYYYKTFHKTIQDLIDFYNFDKEYIERIKTDAINSFGQTEPSTIFSFEEFVHLFDDNGEIA